MELCAFRIRAYLIEIGLSGAYAPLPVDSLKEETMKVEPGDIFVLDSQTYLFVLRHPQSGFMDDYGNFPAVVEVVPAIRGFFNLEQDDARFARIIFRDWGNQSLDWAYLVPILANNVVLERLCKLERVGQGRDGVFMRRCWRAVGDIMLSRGPKYRPPTDRQFLELVFAASVQLNELCVLG